MSKEENQSQKPNYPKIISGLLLMMMGFFGLVFGKNLKSASRRIPVLVVSGLSVFVGLYLFVMGLQTNAVGMAYGTKIVDGKITVKSKLQYVSSGYFEDGLKATFKLEPDVRRLTFKCDDGSESFTVFNTRYGILNIPDESVQCDDGSYLIRYHPTLAKY